MKMTKAKKVSAPIAARAIAIDGTHFAQGEEIKGVSQDEVDSCIRLGSVVDVSSEEGEAALLEAEQRAAAEAAAAKKA
jgi:hypothetical protein